MVRTHCQPSVSEIQAIPSAEDSPEEGMQPPYFLLETHGQEELMPVYGLQDPTESNKTKGYLAHMHNNRKLYLISWAELNE